MPELLIELFSEEIPARMQARAAEDLCSLLHGALKPLMQAAPRGLYGPRRITLVGEMAARAETPGKEERGPRLGAPDAALDGFLRKHGARREQLVEQGAFWVLNRPGEVLEAHALLARALPDVLRRFPWPKSMRWGTSPFLWVRPLQRVLCVFDGEAVRFALAHGEDAVHGLLADELTEGHRVLAPGAFTVRSFAEYEARLRERFVVVDAAERARTIEQGVAALAAAEGLEVVPDAGLLAEVAGLVEWPVPLLGRIDDAFMDLPVEVMRTSMRVNQRYFTLRTPDGRAAPRFALVANIVSTDGGAAIVAGNERVLRARLADARFFWDQDRKQTLESFLPKLESVVFHEKLGTQGDRVRRLEKLARVIAPMVGADADDAGRAAKLAKADLASGMVGEFPELQGVMGRYYALAGGEKPAVAEAIGAHYRPLGPGDAVPQEPVAIAVALADKMDQLAGFFAIGERPSGSGDPFALRRAGLGVIRMVRENMLRLGLLGLAGAAVNNVLGCLAAQHGETAPQADYRVVAGVLTDFILERLRVQMRETQRHDVIAAAAVGDDDINRILARAEALRTLIESTDGANLLAAYRRAANILRIEDRKDGPHDGRVDPALFAAPEERALAAALEQVAPQAEAAMATEWFEAAMTALAALRGPVDDFFERIMVNDPQPELRTNRLRLLSRLRDAMDAVADLSKIEG